MPPRPATTTAVLETARRALVAALESWDLEAADAAIVNYAALAPPAALFELLFPYGARDLRAIGHKAITVQNAHRLVAYSDLANAEPLLRSTAAALQNTEGDPNPAANESPADQPWRMNRQRLREIPAAWQQGRDDAGARQALPAALRQSSQQDAGALVVEQLRHGTSPATIWQALFAAAAELVLRAPGVVPVHAQTTANALHHIYLAANEQSTRQLAMLQCAAFIAMFQRFSGNARPDLDLTALESLAIENTMESMIDEIFSELPDNRLRAVRKALAYLGTGESAERTFVARARHYLAHHAGDAHDYKFAEAAFDNASRVADGAWRARLLAASLAYLRGPTPSGSNETVEEAAALLGAGQ
jgi:hypothetical protein